MSHLFIVKLDTVHTRTWHNLHKLPPRDAAEAWILTCLRFPSAYCPGVFTAGYSLHLLCSFHFPEQPNSVRCYTPQSPLPRLRATPPLSQACSLQPCDV